MSLSRHPCPVTLRLGTRRSALALAQSGQIKTRLEALHPGLDVELVGIDTQGDEVHQNRFSTEPLQGLDGKNFFVKELDEALLAGRTDFSVHSYKDLSLERPPELVIAAVPERENPRDIVLFHPSIREKLAAGGPIRLGSSSPRRARNTPEFLQGVLPLSTASPDTSHPNKCEAQSGGGLGVKTSIQMQPLRGNVTTRLRKLEEGQFEGIILAMAGLNRLGIDISEFPKMILPLDACPTAPAQGALAIECRANDSQALSLLAALHHAPTAFHIARERAVLKRFGGGCHQAFGATSLDLAPGLPLTFVRGQSDAGEALDDVEWRAPTYAPPLVAWDGTSHRKDSQTVRIPCPIPPTPNLFAAHHRAVPLGFPSPARLWTAGVMSWRKLAERGYWVEGCAEGLGFDHIAGMLGDLAEWTMLTHTGHGTEDTGYAILATYRIDPSPAEAEELAEATHVYWGSGSQFLRLKHLAARAIHHACGPGKTAETLRASGITPDIFPSRHEWRRAVGLVS